MLAARIIVGAAEAYLVAGLLVAALFVSLGIRRAMPEAGTVTIGARLLIVPAAAGLWPYVLMRWLRRRAGPA